MSLRSSVPGEPRGGGVDSAVLPVAEGAWSRLRLRDQPRQSDCVVAACRAAMRRPSELQRRFASISLSMRPPAINARTLLADPIRIIPAMLSGFNPSGGIRNELSICPCLRPPGQVIRKLRCFGWISVLPLDTGMLLQPGEVIGVGIFGLARGPLLEHVAIIPFADFGVTVGKGQPARMVMIAGRHVAPVCGL